MIGVAIDLGSSVSQLAAMHGDEPQLNQYSQPETLLTDRRDRCPDNIATLLANLRATWLGELRGTPGVVLTVPVCLSARGRRRLRQAAQIANMLPLRLLNEPTAAALCAHVELGFRGLHGVVVAGGGHVDVAFVDLRDEIIEVRATAGSAELGGAAFDALLCRQDRGADALRQAERARIALGRDFETDFCDERLSRSQLLARITPLLGAIGELCHRTLSDSGLRSTDLDGVMLVGGCATTPGLKSVLRGALQRNPVVLDNPADWPARGAARHAHRLTQHAQDPPMLLEVSARPLTITPSGSLPCTLLPSGTLLPASARQSFVATHGDRLELLVGDGPYQIESVTVAGQEVAVGVALDTDGALELAATDPAGHSIRIVRSPRPSTPP